MSVSICKYCGERIRKREDNIYVDMKGERDCSANEDPESKLHLPYAKLGSISHGTLRTEYLLDAFAKHLLELCGDNEEHKKLAEEAYDIVKNWSDDWDEFKLESIHELLWVDLGGVLEEYAPPYSYFGTHEGDGSDFGYWLDLEALNEAIREGVKLEDSEYMRLDDGYIVHVNERGNTTLYQPCDNIDWDSDNSFKEIWSLV